MKGKIRKSCYSIINQKYSEYFDSDFTFDLFTCYPYMKLTNGLARAKLDFIEGTETTSVEEIDIILKYEELFNKYDKIFFFIETDNFMVDSFRFPGEGFFFRESNCSETELPEYMLRKILENILYQIASEKNMQIFDITFDSESRFYFVKAKEDGVIFATKIPQELFEFINKS